MLRLLWKHIWWSCLLVLSPISVQTNADLFVEASWNITCINNAPSHASETSWLIETFLFPNQLLFVPSCYFQTADCNNVDQFEIGAFYLIKKPLRSDRFYCQGLAPAKTFTAFGIASHVLCLSITYNIVESMAFLFIFHISLHKVAQEHMHNPWIGHIIIDKCLHHCHHTILYGHAPKSLEIFMFAS